MKIDDREDEQRPPAEDVGELAVDRREIVETIRYAVVTQACWLRPCRSSPIVRIAVPTTVWSSADRNMPAMRPKMTNRICRCDMIGFDGAAGAGVTWLVMSLRVESLKGTPEPRATHRCGHKKNLRRVQSYTPCDHFSNVN